MRRRVFHRGLVLAAFLALGICDSAAAGYNVGVTGYPPPPISAGQSEVLLSDSALTYDFLNNANLGLNGQSWTPVSGAPLDVTLWWRPLLRPSDQLNAYVAVQPAQRPCAASPAADHQRLLVEPHFIEQASEVSGVYSLEFTKQITLPQAGYVQACSWLARSPHEQIAPSSQLIPLLNDAFAGVVTNVYNLVAGVTGFFDLEYDSLLAPSSLTFAPVFETAPIPGGTNGGLGTYLSSCQPDFSGWVQFGFPGGPKTVSFVNCAGAYSTVPVVDNVGGCLTNVPGFTVAEAVEFIDLQGCTVDYLEPNNEFGDVNATVDGGGVNVVPYGTHVDLSIPDYPVTEPRPPSKAPYSTALPAPAGAECDDLATISKGFGSVERRNFRVASVSSDDLPVAVTVSVSLGSVGVCRRGSITDLAGELGLSPSPRFELSGSDDSGGKPLQRTARYSFAPLGWHVEAGDGAQTFNPPTIEWSNSTGVSVSPALELTAEGKGPPEITLNLISVPVSQATAILVARGKPFLDATVGPTFKFGLTLNRDEAQKLIEEAMALGLDAAAATAYVVAELGDEVENALITFAPEVGPLGPLNPQGYEPDMSSIVDEVDAEFQAEYSADDVVADLDDGVTPEETEELIDNIIEFPGEVIEAAGETVEDVAPEAVAAAGDGPGAELELAGGGRVPQLMLRVPPSPRLVPSKGKLLAPHTVSATSIVSLDAGKFVRAPLPAGEIASAVRGDLGLPVIASVGALAVDSTRLSAGGSLTVVAPGLSSSATGADLVLAGPGYHATRLLQVKDGGTGATIHLPPKLTAGRWVVAVEDLSGVSTGSNSAPSGQAIVRMAIFTVH